MPAKRIAPPAGKKFGNLEKKPETEAPIEIERD